MGVVYCRAASLDRSPRWRSRCSSPTTPRITNDQREKFLSEAVVTGDLDHPNIVPIYDLGANETGALFYSMKRVEGTPWSKVLASKSLGENLEILMKVADAIAFAHASRCDASGHQTRKHDMLGEFGEVLVMDWGLAASSRRPFASPAASRKRAAWKSARPPTWHTGNGLRAARTHRPVPATSIHSGSAVLVEIITGRQPHAGTQRDEVFPGRGLGNEIVPVEHSGELMSITLPEPPGRKPANRYAKAMRDLSKRGFAQYQSHSGKHRTGGPRRRRRLAAMAETSGDYQTSRVPCSAFKRPWLSGMRTSVPGSVCRRPVWLTRGRRWPKPTSTWGCRCSTPTIRNTSRSGEELAARPGRARRASAATLKNAKRNRHRSLAAAHGDCGDRGSGRRSIREKDRAVVAEGEAKEQRDIAVGWLKGARRESRKRMPKQSAEGA